MPILFLIATLVVCIVIAIIVMYWANIKPSRDFKKLSTPLGLNFALSEQTGFLQMSKPALVGVYNQRHIQISVEERDNNGNTITQLLMTCEYDEASFIIKKKTWLERNFYPYPYKNIEPKNRLLTSDRSFDHCFIIETKQKSLVRRLFTESIRKYLMDHYDIMSGNVEIKDFEMLMLGSQLFNFKQSNASQQKIIREELKFLDGLGSLIEMKMQSIHQPLKVNNSKLNDKLNFKWGWRG